jgi:hypothetical protein
MFTRFWQSQASRWQLFNFEARYLRSSLAQNVAIQPIAGMWHLSLKK